MDIELIGFLCFFGVCVYQDRWWENWFLIGGTHVPVIGEPGYVRMPSEANKKQYKYTVESQGSTVKSGQLFKFK